MHVPHVVLGMMGLSVEEDWVGLPAGQQLRPLGFTAAHVGSVPGQGAETHTHVARPRVKKKLCK